MLSCSCKTMDEGPRLQQAIQPLRSDLLINVLLSI
nr:MAG TPA: hypothetical protein [Caudoviricetes sp.]